MWCCAAKVSNFLMRSTIERCKQKGYEIAVCETRSPITRHIMLNKIHGTQIACETDIVKNISPSEYSKIQRPKTRFEHYMIIADTIRSFANWNFREVSPGPAYRTRDELIEWIRGNATSGFHYIGTC
ncbi:unnamed protein product [Didymodactylos carnosus]|uniref:Uncharacterized protein n=1 Tax=Didymodactylos carnosus TaxID=1234261 RepID=A0A814UP86_9BILA|nr:unnamed protein product [Didymodactylos carnosus]CAF3941115.1 unnamed protein product [Didymodactylos carnosus]